MIEARTLLTGLVIGESARWHDGRLWFAHWGTGEILAVTTDGKREVVGHGPPGLGWSIDWLPDGRLLVTGQGLTRREPDGPMVPHADLSGLAKGWNEIVVDGRGNVYVNGGCEFHPETGMAPGLIAMVTPDGAVRKVAENIAFPNGMVVTPDNSTLVIAESFARCLTAFDIAADGSLSNRRVWANRTGDGICMDADGAILVLGDDEQGRQRRSHRQRRGGTGSSSSGPALLLLHARRRRRPDALHARRRLAHGGRVRREHPPPDHRAADGQAPDRPGAGPTRRLALNGSAVHTSRPGIIPTATCVTMLPRKRSR